jgi:hypothetical protein
MKATNMSKYRRIYGDAQVVTQGISSRLESGDLAATLTTDSLKLNSAIRSSSRALHQGGYGLFGRRTLQ